MTTLLQKPEPIVIEAAPEKTFPHEWVSNFLVHCPSLTSGRAKFELLPYNSDTKEIGEGKYMETIEVDDLFACVSEVPEAYASYNAILAAIEPIRAWVESRRAEQQTEQPQQ